MDPLSLALLVIAAGALFFLLLLYLVLRSRRKRTSRGTAVLENMTIDLEALSLATLPSGAASLNVYSAPAQLAVLVLAPVGRGHDLPDKEQWRTLLEQLCPGFGKVLDEHQPVFRRWPPQVSNQGFNRAFFGNMRSSDQPLAKTHWYKLAGRLDWFDRQILIGIVARSRSMTRVAPVEVEQPGKWREILRVGQFE